jgi:hypothetical protein
MTGTTTRRSQCRPKTPKGRLAVRLNASTHGILSAQPVVGACGRAEDWEGPREAVVDSLFPEGGIERVLAERVALCSWRLNWVVLYESESVSELQEGVLESVRERRKRRPEVERLLAKTGEKVLTDVGILVEAHPRNAIEDAKMALLSCKTGEKLFDAPADAIVKGPDAPVVLGLAVEHAVKQTAYQADEEVEDEDVAMVTESLLERLPGVPEGAFLEDSDWTVGRPREFVGWLAVEAGGKPEANTVDRSVIGPEEALMEALHTTARYDAATKEAKGALLKRCSWTSTPRTSPPTAIRKGATPTATTSSTSTTPCSSSTARRGT